MAAQEKRNFSRQPTRQLRGEGTLEVVQHCHDPQVFQLVRPV
jgi:hypothetical protein